MDAPFEKKASTISRIGLSKGRASASKEMLPTISFVVTNYNYGDFLNRCVQSIFNQNYPNIECIVIDDASTDNSVQIIHALEVPEGVRFERVINPHNIGQAASCVVGFRHSTGDYVGFIDADDELLPDYACAHLLAHFKSRKPVGFSSCDMLVLVDEKIILETVFNHHSYNFDTRLISSEDTLPIAPEIEQFFACTPKFNMRYVRRECLTWPWSPTSGTVYRRDALALFIDNDDLPTLNYAADAYFHFALNSLCGSVLIDSQFAKYHVHRRNFFAQCGYLYGLRHFDHKRDFGGDAAYLAMKHIVRNFEFFAYKMHHITDLNVALKTLARKAGSYSKLSKFAFSVFVRLLELRWRLTLRSLGDRV